MINRSLFFLVVLFVASCGGSGGSGAGGSTTPPPVVQTPDTRSPSIARQWNEVTLDAIRNDFARPTVHARNLFQISAAMYDAWAAYSSVSDAYLLGNQLGTFSCGLNAFAAPADIHPAREEAIAYAAYRLILHRFASSPGATDTISAADALMQQFGFNTADTSLAYENGSPAALGNYIARCYIDFGMQDGANEANDYANISYAPVNPPIEPEQPGNPDIVDLDRWQPISLALFIDQSGNVITDEPEFLSPEWGRLIPFALTDADKTTYQRDGFDYEVYFDPGAPPSYTGASSDDYKWGFSLVAIWGSHLDSSDGVMIDISPASVGNIEQLPASVADYPLFYDYLNGGDGSQGYATNPVTGAPYAQQIVPRGDYTRVLAEFWADGPDSETPPGHWFVILNEVNDDPELARRFGGQGDELGPLEWDIKGYFALGGAMHDSAIAAWGIKGWYDYLRPVSAIRAMADRGQSSDPMAASYSVDGIPLVPGYIELVATGDPLAGASDENVGKIKLYTWRGPDYVNNPFVDEAGVDWILAENWWPYQRPSFVTPPFAGYVSGHSTYSRAAAEVLTALTGSAYFPGGMSGFEIAANDFLVFENGPSVDMTLQWATYRDASDQCSLSRIWGGIHPPADDIPGRIIGERIGVDAFDLAATYFNGG
ncbi:MAG: vanadium-dependent haloperoxidase [Gammaproteobacteria bacterium]|nr:vanadium-dependent haloperoxidase [Gammaproteobacteria bacterium]MBU2676880.1 vanadium-dependent haloperoxidase [Gammaproteobacteria bacterium]NNC56707.1 vanadium-dependent haloperoxidase [Woeseiaceae bacterium]NNL50613.1 vanadium-dependent haloperoxidase [Woeseiaceae bacterium]